MVLSSSSGLGHHPLTVEIAGSSPAGSELKKLPNLQIIPNLQNNLKIYEF